jgi:hypothetical protein
LGWDPNKRESGVHIFIDESGTFGGLGSDKPAISAQGALILPSYQLPRLFAKYAKLRLRLPKRSGEVKGSLLNEQQVACVVELLRKNGSIFCGSMIDMADHTEDDISNHRARGVDSLAANLTDGHTPELRAAVADLQKRMAGFSGPLYVQMMVMIDLLHRVLEEMVNYHCQRNPKELAEFHWVVDGKEPTCVTDWEDWWSKTLVVWLQAISLKRPAVMLESGDYRHFQRFILKELPAYLQDHAPETDRRLGAGFDLQLLFRESFRFSTDVEPGLELVDIVTNALRRALTGNLGEDGWLPLRSLMIHRRDIYVRPVSLLFEDRKLTRSYSKVLHSFRSGGRNMLTARRYAAGEEA